MSTDITVRHERSGIPLCRGNQKNHGRICTMHDMDYKKLSAIGRKDSQKAKNWKKIEIFLQKRCSDDNL